MNYLLIITCLVSCSLAGILSVSVEHLEWRSFKQTHGKQYESQHEETRRREIYVKTKSWIEEFNAKQAEELNFTLGLNHFADWEKEERAHLNGIIHPSAEFYHIQNDPEAQRFLDDILNEPGEVPEEVDWRKVPGRVSPVKFQGICKSCWAFTATGVLEGQQMVRNGNRSKLVDLSEQNLVDCTKINFGCKGGFPAHAFTTIKDLGGIEEERAYPYEGKDGECRFSKEHVAFSAKGYAQLPEGDEKALKKVIAKYGPVSIAIQSSELFEHYKSGVYSNKDCLGDKTKVSHAVLAIGYGTDPEEGDYWLLKNSWSETWGENGFGKIARNKNNMCGVTFYASIATF